VRRSIVCEKPADIPPSASWDDFDSLPVFDINDGWTVTGSWVTLFNSLFSENIALYLSGDSGPFSSRDISLRLPRMFVNNQSIYSIDCNGSTFRDPTQVCRIASLTLR
jgi:hypothetical protein